MIKYSRLSDYNIRKIIGCFYLDLTALQTAEITGFNRNTINRFFNILENLFFLMILDIVSKGFSLFLKIPLSFPLQSFPRSLSHLFISNY
ncbi:MAG: hypothetical protein Ta2D_10140 [Rickettsiales bacterium]|nr:MAG: hypothetical protein Ta2D_10140 [Rickettsiales bacterium]